MMPFMEYICRRIKYILIILTLFWFGYWAFFDTQNEVSFPADNHKRHARGNDKVNNVQGTFTPIKTKEVLIFGSFDEMLTWPELELFHEIFDKKTRMGKLDCYRHYTSFKITVSNNVTDFKGKDVIIFGILGKALYGHLDQVIRAHPAPEQTWVYFSTETPHRIIKWTEDLRFQELKYHIMMTYRADSEVQIPFGFYRERRQGSPPFDETEIDRALQKKSKFMYWMGSNCAEVYWPRMGYLKHLKQYMPLETFGRCGDTPCLPVRSPDCLNRLTDQFKFSLSIANSECTDYITEKLWVNSLPKYIIPVVYGATKENYERVAPPNSFIHISDFNTTQQLTDYLHKVAGNEQLYRQYFEWKKKYEAKSSFPVNPRQLCKLVPHIYHGKEQKVKRIGDSNWYNGCRTPITKKSMRFFPPDEQKRVIDDWKVWRP